MGVSLTCDEVTHALIEQDVIKDRGDDQLNEDYAKLVDDYSAENYEFNFSNNELGELNTGDSNQHVGNETSELLITNTEEYRESVAANPEAVDYLLPQFVEEFRDWLNAKMDESKEASAQLQGDAIGTGLSVVAAAGDISVDFLNLGHL